MAILIFIVVLAVLILVHEFGHFSVAKFFKMRVDEFGVGFPPKLFSKKIGETEYSFNAIPFGGFVRIFGENPEEGKDEERSFSSRGKLAQIAVLAAGVVFNLLLAWLLIAIGLSAGMPMSKSSGNLSKYVENEKMIVITVTEDSPAEKAGLESGQEILSISSSGKMIESENLSPEALQQFVLDGQGDEIAITYRNLEGEIETSLITPSFEIDPDRPVIGVATDLIGRARLNPFLAIWESLKITLSSFGAIIVGFVTLIIEAIQGSANVNELVGPVGIIGFIGDASALGFIYLLSFTAFISINLAVINLIPFPALDGGRILFAIIESIRGKDINPNTANKLNLIGFVILIILMVVITYHDIVRLIS